MSPEDKIIRFAVGSKDNLLSSVWRLWITRDEIYLASRSFISFIKFSFHSSGIWRLAQNSTEPRKAMYSWNRPPSSLGITQCVSIAIPPILVSKPFSTKYEKKSKVRWFSSLNNEKRIFKIVFSTDGVNESDILKFLPNHSEIVWNKVIPNKEVITLATWKESLSVEEKTSIKNSIKKLKIHVKPGTDKKLFSNTFMYEMILPAQGTDDQPTVFDLALGEENLECP